MTAKIYRPTPRNLEKLARALAKGELVAVPTETVYGLAADALNVDACREIFRAKGRPANDPLIVHVHDLAQVADLADVNAAAKRLAKNFWPGPLTIVLPKKSIVPDLVTSGQSSVAVRMPAHPVFRKLLRLASRPLAAPSANPFGYLSPTTARHVAESLGHQIRYILDGGPAKIGLESTIVDLRQPKRPTILRPGAISREELERCLKSRVFLASREMADNTTAAPAPGMLTRHYSPRTSLTLHARLTHGHVVAGGRTEAFVFFGGEAASATSKRPRHQKPNTFFLSRRGDPAEAGRKLFSLLRELDAQTWKRIHVELPPGDDGLSRAIHDRLQRAAAKR